jgi:hypothetical protein
MFKKMPITEAADRPITLALDERTPFVVIVASPGVYDALEAAVEIAYANPDDVPLEYREAGTELWAGFHDGA